MSKLNSENSLLSSSVPDPDFWAKELQKLRSLGKSVPQTLLIEGSTGELRFNFAIYWALLPNCPEVEKHQGAPCLKCSVCRQIMAKECSDILFFDGRISNREEDEAPGIIHALNMDNMRKLKAVLGSEPRTVRKRVVIIDGLTMLREEALNSLLKTLEEPSLGTLFVLLAPLREQILPTLVSRSICFTLPWKKLKSDAIHAFENSLGDFLLTGKGFLQDISAKGAMDAKSAEELLLACQRALLNALAAKRPGSLLDKFFATVSTNPHAVAQTGYWMDEAQQMLAAGVTPARCLEAFATRLFETGKIIKKRIK